MRLLVVASREFDLDEMEASFARDEGPRHVAGSLRTRHDVVMVTPAVEMARHPRRYRWLSRLFSTAASWAAVLAAARAATGDDVLLFLGDDMGIEYALMSTLHLAPRKPRVMVYVQELDHRLNRRLLDRFRGRIDVLLTPTPDQHRKAEALAAGRRRRRPFVDDLVGLDIDFFSPGPPGTAYETTGRHLVASAGLVHRDYRALAAAVEGLPVDVEICAAASMPVDPGDTLFPPDGTASLTVEAHSLRGLRDLYRRASLVVVPLTPDAFGGFTVISEALACGVPVVATASNDGIREMGETGLIVTVPPGDAVALRAAIVGLLEDPARRARLGAAGRAYAVEHLSNDEGARQVSSAVADVPPRAG